MHKRNLLLLTMAMGMSMFNSHPVHAQFAGAPNRDNFRDTSILKPAAGSKVSVIVFEDLGCPLCARAHPIEIEAAQKYHVPLLRHDFPLAQHIWTFDGAVCARYLQDRVSPKLADEYRSAVFLSQSSIATKDDLQQFTRRWFQTHGQAMPFVIDPTGKCAAEVEADCALGRRAGVVHTPTLVVATAHGWIEVTEPNQLYAAIDHAEAEVNGRPKAR